MEEPVPEQPVESTVDEHAEAEVSEAKAIGWVPKERFKGNPDDWVDAHEFLARGEKFIPFLKASKKKLEDRVNTQSQQIAELQNQLRANSMAVEEIKSTSTKSDTNAEIAELRTQIAAAMREGEYEKAEELRDQMADKRASLRNPTQAQVPGGAPSGIENTPEWREFLDENPWWVSDAGLRAAAVEVAKEMDRNGELTPMTGPRERLSKIAEEVRERYMTNVRRSAPSKVGSSRPAPRRANGRSYADLPAEAKRACDDYVPRLVGEGKKFKDVESWQKSYAAKYFEGEA